MPRLWTLMLLIAFVLLSGALAADEEAEKPAIKRILINVFPHDVIVIRAKMILMKDLRDHLAKLVAPARRAAVEITIIPQTEGEMSQVARVVLIARDLGYRKVAYESPKRKEKVLREVRILVSRTGLILVNNAEVTEKKLREHLEKLVKADRRPKVRVIVNASRRVKMKRVTNVTKLCRDLGFKKIYFQLIPE